MIEKFNNVVPSIWTEIRRAMRMAAINNIFKN